MLCDSGAPRARVGGAGCAGGGGVFCARMFASAEKRAVRKPPGENPRENSGEKAIGEIHMVKAHGKKACKKQACKKP